jgi:hypothetical protein
MLSHLQVDAQGHVADHPSTEPETQKLTFLSENILLVICVSSFACPSWLEPALLLAVILFRRLFAGKPIGGLRPGAGASRNEWRTLMLRKTFIALAAMAAVTAGSTMASAGMHGGMGHGGFGRMGGFGHGGFGHARPAFAHPGGFRHFAGARPFAFHNRFHPRRFAFRHRHHRVVFSRFAFYGAAYPYAYDDSCYARVWTRWGWRWIWACY